MTLAVLAHCLDFGELNLTPAGPPLYFFQSERDVVEGSRATSVESRETVTRLTGISCDNLFLLRSSPSPSCWQASLSCCPSRQTTGHAIHRFVPPWSFFLFLLISGRAAGAFFSVCTVCPAPTPTWLPCLCCLADVCFVGVSLAKWGDERRLFFRPPPPFARRCGSLNPAAVYMATAQNGFTRIYPF